jgi:hypothetical protein
MAYQSPPGQARSIVLSCIDGDFLRFSRVHTHGVIPHALQHGSAAAQMRDLTLNMLKQG